ncbi:MAG TPA: ABC transporter, partial [Azospirillaceae bacterium]|nr:ABC transporter [Azospirillaceae bacterium]
ALEVQSGEAARRRAVPYPAWLGLGPENRDRDDPASADLGLLNLASAGEILAKEGSGVALAPLLSSSAQGRLLDVTLLRGMPEPERLMAALAKEKDPAGADRRVLAARVFGTLKSAFPDGPPPPEVKPGETVPAPTPLSTPHLAHSVEPPKLLVVADSDMLEDRFWVEQQNLLGRRFSTPFAGNGDFVLNVVEHMAGGADLIGLRGRAGSSRPFTLVDELRRAAGEQMLAREDELLRQLREAERRIVELQSKAKGGGGALLSDEERKEIEGFRAEALTARKELRDVQHALNKDIERLAATVKAVNIVGVPLLVALAALMLAAARARGRRGAALNKEA